MGMATEAREHTAFDCKHVKSVHGWALVHQEGDAKRGNSAGKIVCDFSDNPAGSVCTATLYFWAGPLAGMRGVTGRAGGYGYDKASAACDQAFRKGAKSRGEYTPDENWDRLQAALTENPIPNMGGCGMSAVEAWLARFGYQCIQVI